MKILIFFIMSHNSYGLLHSFFILFSFLFHWLGNSQCPILQVTDSFVWSSLLLKLSIEFFRSVVIFFNSRISGVFFDGCYYLAELLILCIYCFSNFSQLSVFSCSSQKCSKERDYSEFFVWQFIDIDVFRVTYWSFISFCWWFTFT